MTKTNELSKQLIQQWFTEKHNLDVVEKKLKDLGYDELLIYSYIKEYKRLKYARRQNIGFGLAGFGALLGFISCVLTMVNPLPDLINFFLYGLTSIAVLIFFIGFYFIFE